MSEPFYLKENDERTLAVINNLKELRDALKIAPKQAIKHHTSNGKNDFAIWIHESLGMGNLAFKIACVNGDEEKIKQKIIKILNKELMKNDLKDLMRKFLKMKSF